MAVRLELGRTFMRRAAIYSLALGAAYWLVGALEMANAISSWLVPGLGPVLKSPWIPPDDFFGAFSAMVIGAVFSCSRGLLKGKREDIAFVLVGTVLAGTFGALYILTSLAGALEALIAGEEALEALIEGLRRPEIWLFLSSLPLAYSSWTSVLRREGRSC